MKHKILAILAVTLFLLISYKISSAQMTDKMPILFYTDLITDGVSYKTLEDTTVQVAVRNLGNKDAKSSVLRFIFTKDNKNVSKMVEVGPVKAKDAVWVKVSLSGNLQRSKYCVTADITNQIKETKEDNNTRCGEFGGSLVKQNNVFMNLKEKNAENDLPASENLIFTKGQPAVFKSGTTDQTHLYFVKVKAGQSLAVSLTSKDSIARFDIIAVPGSGTPFVRETDEWSGKIKRSGEFVIQVYGLYGKKTIFSLDVSLH